MVILRGNGGHHQPEDMQECPDGEQPLGSIIIEYLKIMSTMNDDLPLDRELDFMPELTLPMTNPAAKSTNGSKDRIQAMLEDEYDCNW